MKTAFMDTNVVIDFLTNREPFSLEVMNIFNYSRKENLKLYVSSITMATAYYLISKIETEASARRKIAVLNKLVAVLNVGQKEIDMAIDSNFKDLEDAIQNFCAGENNMQIIITRNAKDFKRSELSILSPREYWIKIEDEKE